MEAVVEARREYMIMIQECMIPEMSSTFLRMYDDTEEMLRGGRGRVAKFKEISSEISEWSENTVDVHVERIQAECPWFDKLIEASIVSLVQILKSVKINSQSVKLSLTIPSTSEFVRKCYKAAQVLICKSPEFLTDDDHRESGLVARITKAIDVVIRSYVPLQNIITMNISSPEEPEPQYESESEPEETKTIEETKSIVEDDVLMPDATE